MPAPTHDNQNTGLLDSPVPDPTMPSVRGGGLVAGLAASMALAACGGGHVGMPGPEGVETKSSLAGMGGSEPGRAVAGSRPTTVDAARFLSQATFGARSVD